MLFNTQWFVSYLPDYHDGFTVNGPVNVFFTFAMSTGYYQDRVIPQLLTVYEFASRSGGVLPSVEYRFTDSLSVTVGMLYFFGRTELSDMAVQEISPVINRTGPQRLSPAGRERLLGHPQARRGVREDALDVLDYRVVPQRPGRAD